MRHLIFEAGASLLVSNNLTKDLMAINELCTLICIL